MIVQLPATSQLNETHESGSIARIALISSEDCVLQRTVVPAASRAVQVPATTVPLTRVSHRRYCTASAALRAEPKAPLAARPAALTLTGLLVLLPAEAMPPTLARTAANMNALRFIGFS